MTAARCCRLQRRRLTLLRWNGTHLPLSQDSSQCCFTRSTPDLHSLAGRTPADVRNQMKCFTAGSQALTPLHCCTDGIARGIILLHSNGVDVQLTQGSIQYRILGGVPDLYILAGLNQLTKQLLASS